VRGFVADDGAVALQWADGKNLVNHFSIVASRRSTGAEAPSFLAPNAALKRRSSTVAQAFSTAPQGFPSAAKAAPFLDL
jgi:hypothetical protein